MAVGVAADLLGAAPKFDLFNDNTYRQYFVPSAINGDTVVSTANRVAYHYV
jgi:hypothetical protein